MNEIIPSTFSLLLSPNHRLDLLPRYAGVSWFYKYFYHITRQGRADDMAVYLAWLKQGLLQMSSMHPRSGGPSTMHLRESVTVTSTVKAGTAPSRDVSILCKQQIPSMGPGRSGETKASQLLFLDDNYVPLMIAFPNAQDH